jgi:hypothetical protein
VNEFLIDELRRLFPLSFIPSPAKVLMEKAADALEMADAEIKDLKRLLGERIIRGHNFVITAEVEPLPPDA